MFLQDISEGKYCAVKQRIVFQQLFKNVLCNKVKIIIVGVFQNGGLAMSGVAASLIDADTVIMPPVLQFSFLVIFFFSVFDDIKKKKSRNKKARDSFYRIEIVYIMKSCVLDKA